jgi:DNA-binding NarL/FixJ family response regulator
MSQNKNRMRIRVLIVDDHPAVREALASRIGLQPDLEVCGEAADMGEALRLMAETRPHLAVVDIKLKTSDGIDLIKRIKGRDDHVRILVWSAHSEALYAERALHAGAQGYVNKDQATDRIIEAIRRVLEGKVYLSDEMSAQLLARVVGGRTKPIEQSSLESLSDRELEVFKFLAEGLTTEKMARAMRVSPKTVETYRGRIKEKLGLTNFTELVQWAARWAVENP